LNGQIAVSRENINILTDADFLLENFIKGDPDSFEKIYKSFYPYLYNYGCQFGIDKSDVDDSIQEVFLDLWDSRNHLNINALKPYIFRCLRNKISRNIFRSLNEKKKEEKYIREEFKIYYSSGTEEVEQNRSDLERRVVDQIEQLSPKQREIIFLIKNDTCFHVTYVTWLFKA